MKKNLLITAALLAASQLATANELYPLTVPSDVPKGNQPSSRVCEATSFNADDTAVGVCTSSTAGVCAGRACSPPYTYLVYATVFNAQGSPIADEFCGTFKVHRPTPGTWVFQPGFDISTCYLPGGVAYPQILVFDPSVGYEHWFSYITTSADGLYELLAYGKQGYINQF